MKNFQKDNLYDFLNSGSEEHRNVFSIFSPFSYRDVNLKKCWSFLHWRIYYIRILLQLW